MMDFDDLYSLVKQFGKLLLKFDDGMEVWVVGRKPAELAIKVRRDLRSITLDGRSMTMDAEELAAEICNTAASVPEDDGRSNDEAERPDGFDEEMRR
jgi:hypothetical protein